MVRALGVDAAGRFGWVGVVIDDDGFAGAHLAASLSEVIASADGAAPAGDPICSVGIDIPIGLIDGPKRAADVAAREFVGLRRASVFWAPHFSAAPFTSQAAANRHLASIGMPMLSAQAMGLMGRMRETVVVANADPRLIEVFPEASFRQMAGDSLSHAKKTATGALQRLRLLAEAEPGVTLPSHIGAAGAVPLDDMFDAAAAGWSARRHALGEAVALGDPAEVDALTGRPIAVWV